MTRLVQRKNKQKIMIALAVVIVLLIAAITMVLLISARRAEKDALADEGGVQTEEGIRQKLQEEVDEGKIDFSINTKPKFETPEGEGSLFIENGANNKVEIKVDIKLDETGETIYESPVLKPGEQILYAKLQKVLTVGEHEATALVSVMESGTGKLQSQFQVALAIELQGAES
ncbi:MAG: hypothetical protein RRZ24_09630 [Clostridia bacterium]